MVVILVDVRLAALDVGAPGDLAALADRRERAAVLRIGVAAAGEPGNRQREPGQRGARQPPRARSITWSVTWSIALDHASSMPDKPERLARRAKLSAGARRA